MTRDLYFHDILTNCSLPNAHPMCLDFELTLGWLGSVVVGRWTCDREIAGSTRRPMCGRWAPHQPTYAPLEHSPLLLGFPSCRYSPLVSVCVCVLLVQVIFAPRLAGVYVAQLRLTSAPVDHSLPVAGKLPVMVTLQAVAENPSIEVTAVSFVCSFVMMTAA